MQFHSKWSHLKPWFANDGWVPSSFCLVFLFITSASLEASFIWKLSMAFALSLCSERYAKQWLWFHDLLDNLKRLIYFIWCGHESFEGERWEVSPSTGVCWKRTRDRRLSKRHKDNSNELPKSVRHNDCQSTYELDNSCHNLTKEGNVLSVQLHPSVTLPIIWRI